MWAASIFYILTLISEYTDWKYLSSPQCTGCLTTLVIVSFAVQKPFISHYCLDKHPLWSSCKKPVSGCTCWEVWILWSGVQSEAFSSLCCARAGFCGALASRALSPASWLMQWAVCSTTLSCYYHQALHQSPKAAGLQDLGLEPPQPWAK